MAKRIYQFKDGVQVPLTDKQIRSFIMKNRGWTAKQYEKEYDKLRNRLRAYEKYQQISGAVVEKQSPASLLYFETKSMKRRGTAYKQSLEMQRIQSFPSISSGKALSKALQNRLESFERRYTKTTMQAFSGLIKANPTASRIAESVTNPVKREQALKDFAAKLHLKQDEIGRMEKLAAIPFGYSVGSDIAITFDIEKYL